MFDIDAVHGYDVVIIGGGVAGCVLAARMSEDPDRSVCLVEAGPDFGPDQLSWPRRILDARLLPREDVWEPDSAPYRIRGKILGGSSSINGCWHTWGSFTDYQEWAMAGGDEWSAKALERFRRTASGKMRLRGIPEHELSVWSKSSLAAAAELGYPEVADMSALSSGPGYGCPPVNAISEFRWNAAFAYLGKARSRANLHILSSATSWKLTVREGRVDQADVMVAGNRLALHADMYVLAAGAYGSPGILLRSGIGPAAHLEQVGVPPVIDLPGVGANLIDHPGLVYPMLPSPELNQELAEQERTGELYASQVAIRAASTPGGDGDWDLHLLPTAGVPLFGTLPPGQYEIGIAAFLMKPRSRGTVRLRSDDPESPLEILPALLSDPGGHDVAAARQGLRLAADLASSAPLKQWGASAESVNPEDLTDADLRARAGTYWHPVGTCAMGPDEDRQAVVDNAGAVRGTTNLRVIDASILPTIPRANTQLSVLAVAEMMAAKLRSY